MFRKMPSRCVTAVAFVVAVVPLTAQTLNIRLGTIVPDQSPWTAALRTMGAAWQRTTENRVRLTVNAGGDPNGGESAIVDKLALDGFEAATLTVSGLAAIDKSFNVFAMPFFFESDGEFAYVQRKLTPMLSQKLEAKKFHLINWGNGGWVRLFSKQPLRSLADIQKARLFTTEGDPDSVKWYAANGFNAVPLAATQIKTQLMLPTGAINAAPSPPTYAAAIGFFRDAPYMLDVPLGPLTAATILTDRAWSRISAADRTKMLAAAALAEKDLNANAPALDARYIDVMKQSSLTVVTMEAKAVADLRAAADRMVQSQSGVIVPQDVFRAATQFREEYRKGQR